MLQSITLEQTARSDFEKKTCTIMIKRTERTGWHGKTVSLGAFLRLTAWCERRGAKVSEHGDPDTWIASYNFPHPIELDPTQDRWMYLLTASLADEIIAKGLVETPASRELCAGRMADTLGTLMEEADIEMRARIKILGAQFWMMR